MAVAMGMEKEGTVDKKPPMEQRRVVVTGMGVETSLGHDPNTFYENLLQGNSGISQIENFDCSEFPTVISKYYISRVSPFDFVVYLNIFPCFCFYL